MKNNDAVLSTGDAARLLQCSNETVRRLIDSGELCATRLSSMGHYRIRYGDLLEYAASKDITLAEEEQK